MNALRMGIAALAITAAAGLTNEAKADKWVVRVELQEIFTGTTIYPTIYSSTDKQSAEFIYFWERVLFVNAPDTFREGISDLIPPNSYWIPRDVILVYLPTINVVGRR
jgi:hypothetical protein